MCMTRKLPLGSGRSGDSGGGAAPSAKQAAATALEKFSRCRQITAGLPASTRPQTTSARESPESVLEEGEFPDRPERANAASASTVPPKLAAYGRTVSVQRSAGELSTRARGAKQASSPASASASLAPLASSGRD